MAAIDPCTEYNLALAVEDFVPVVLAGVALVLTAQATRHRAPRAFPVALIGAVVVTAGGLSKATWKLLVTTGCWRYDTLADLLFPALAVGFAALAWALWCAGRAEVPGWPFAVFVVGAAIGALWMEDTWPLLIAAALGASVLGITAAVIALRAGRPGVATLFVIYVVGTNVLPPLAARPDQSLQVQWAAQVTNTVVQLCFLLGALWLRQQLSRPAASSADDKMGAPA